MLYEINRYLTTRLKAEFVTKRLQITDIAIGRSARAYIACEGYVSVLIDKGIIHFSLWRASMCENKVEVNNKLEVLAMFRAEPAPLRAWRPAQADIILRTSPSFGF